MSLRDREIQRAFELRHELGEAIKEAKLSRRNLLKLGSAIGGSVLLTDVMAKGGVEDTLGLPALPTSPTHTPWKDELYIPPDAQPMHCTHDECDRMEADPIFNAQYRSEYPEMDVFGDVCTKGVNVGKNEVRWYEHQAWDQYPWKKLYYQDLTEVNAKWHSDWGNTDPVWLFNGQFPGPVIRAKYGEPIVVRRRNKLPGLATPQAYGRPSFSTHLHNGHTPSESDGTPVFYVEPGQFHDYHYPNVRAGCTDPRYAATGGDPAETMTTLWYHDHMHDFTSQNVYRGMAGWYLLYDELDTGDETQGLRLPSGKFDVPLMFHDRRFDNLGKAFWDHSQFDGQLGDKQTVNGQIQPFLKVARRKYRFRMLNIGPSRICEYFMSNNMPFVVLTTDGNMLEKPVVKQSLRMSPAERHDVILDFTRLPIGSTVYLLNKLEQVNGRGPTGNLLNPFTVGNESYQILKFIVDRDAVGEEKDNSRIPATLRPLPNIDMSEVVRERTFRFDRSGGQWTVNGQLFDENRIDALIKKNTAEIWNIEGSGDWWHPVHIHFEEFRILSRNGLPPPPEEVSRKDVIKLRPGEKVRVFMRFRDFVGRYVMHCHNVVHEDHAMMVRWDITE